MRAHSKQPKFIEIRRGPEWWEYKFREQGPHKFKSTRVPTRPLCGGAQSCKWCHGMGGPQGDWMLFPLRVHGNEVRHTITPPQAAHLVAMEYGLAHPNEPFTVAWLLTEEEVAAGKKGIPESQVP